MDERLARKLVRQLRIMNAFMIFFGVVFLISTAVTGIVLYRIYTYAHNLEQKTSQTLDVQSKLCTNQSVSALLGSSSICK